MAVQANMLAWTKANLTTLAALGEAVAALQGRKLLEGLAADARSPLLETCQGSSTAT